jgi:excinuclease ABC subunit C
MTINLQSIPTDPGVYVFKDQKNQVLYIGKAKNLQKRVTQYFAPGSLRKQEMVAKATTLDFHSTKNESEALYLEDNLIKEYQPYYNNLLKADNSYVYIKITYEDFPQILITRKRLNDKAIYI